MGFLEVLKRSRALESYSRAKLLRSLIYATDHLPGPDAALALSDTIEAKLLGRIDGNRLATEDIAAAALEVLKRFDTRSYVKYLSYQTDTLDAADLRRHLKGSRV